MKRNLTILAFAVVVIAILLFFGSRIAQRKIERARTTGQLVAGHMDGQLAPEFELEDVKGGKLSLASLRGKAVVINFWATWCAPCKIEIPWLVELQNKYGPRGLQIVGVAEDDSGKDSIAAFAREMGMNYPVLLADENIATRYGNVEGLPTTFYIGRDGRVVEHSAGLTGYSEIEESIQKALAAPPGQAQ